ncbi:MAG: hypothetical protein QW514_07125 [Thermoprotei archaeon]
MSWNKSAGRCGAQSVLHIALFGFNFLPWLIATFPLRGSGDWMRATVGISSDKPAAEEAPIMSADFPIFG